MKKLVFFKIILILFLSLFIQCKKETKVILPEDLEETFTSGATTMLVEESIFPIVEDVRDLFQNDYNQTAIKLEKKSEAEILKLIFEDSLRIAILPRPFDSLELAHFKGRLNPRMTHFASDAIVFVTSKRNNDSLLDYNQLLNNLSNENALEDRLLIFDNVNSSIVNKFKEETGKTQFKEDKVYFLPTTKDVIEYVDKNDKAIGVIGLNWLLQPPTDLKELLDNVKVLAVKNSKDGKYYKASQNNIGEGTYPLIRELYVLDIQGKNGLGMGFASYIAGHKGQRIVLKSGLLPAKTPPREISVSKKLNN